MPATFPRKLHTWCLQLHKAHAQTKQEFKILYHEKYAPLKEEHGRCSSEMQRLRDSRDAAKDTAEKWRAQACHPTLHYCFVP